jgi:hypothetical protein
MINLITFLCLVGSSFGFFCMIVLLYSTEFWRQETFSCISIQVKLKRANILEPFIIQM